MLRFQWGLWEIEILHFISFKIEKIWESMQMGFGSVHQATICDGPLLSRGDWSLVLAAMAALLSPISLAALLRDQQVFFFFKEFMCLIKK